MSNAVDLKKVSALLLLIYFGLAIVFYFLIGYQLHFRDSRGNITAPVANAGTVELVSGNSVEQIFTTNIQRLNSISVTWGTNNRTNMGTVTVELFNLADGTRLMAQTLSAADIEEGYISTMSAAAPIENIYQIPLLLRITADSTLGNGISPLMNAAATNDEFQLILNGVAAPGMLCFSAIGEDYIWTGLHYWWFVAAGGVLLIAFLAFMFYQQKKKQKSLIINAIIAVKKYNFLIRQLVLRDFKTKYKRSVLGVLWSFLNPLLTMFVQYIVFSSLFRFEILYYPVYLLCGIILFNFFNEAVAMSLTSIVGNASLITKVYVPKYIYPLTRVFSSLINLLISLVPLFLVVLISGLIPTKAYFLLPFAVFCIAVFSLGLGLLLASAMVFFRDIQFLWGVISMIWMYLTPIFYPESILPAGIDVVLKCNPLYFFIEFFRTCIIAGISPEPIMYAQCILVAFGTLAVGTIVFKKTQDQFVLYI